MRERQLRPMALILTAALLLSALPGPARGTELAGSIGELAGMVSRETEPPQWDFGELPEKSLDAAEEPAAEGEEQPTETAGPKLYFGQLHGHTGDSGGTGTPAEAYAAASAAGLDFFAVTDHSNSFDGAELGNLQEDGAAVSDIWRRGKEAAAAATSGEFLALYGFELSWQNGLGHIGTFFTPGFLSRNQLDHYATALEEYYAALAAVPGAVGQFNHPGTFYGDFEDFGHYSREADGAMQLLEVSCEGADSYDAYVRALDKGWHVGPVNSHNTHGDPWAEIEGRTVVLAEGLTEAAFAAALQNRRVYATEDRNLEILYTLEGYPMGTMLHRRNVGETVTLRVSFNDPDGEAVGRVEVIVEGGAVAAAREIPDSTGEITFELSSDHTYYFLKITQPDGHRAVTAPVWIELQPGAEITSFAADTALAVSGRPMSLRVEVTNRDYREFTVERVTFSLGEQVLHTLSAPAPIPGNSASVYEAEVAAEAAGLTSLTVTVTGSTGGEAVALTAKLELTFLTEDLVTTLVADGSHAALPSLTELEALAAEHRMVLEIAGNLTPEALEDCDILLIPAPERELEEEYLSLLRGFAASGRTLVLWGRSDRDNPNGAEQLNRLAEALGLTARFRDDTVFDPVHNSGRVDEPVSDVYNKEDIFGAGLSGSWIHDRGCTVEPGSGTWLVKGKETAFSVDGDRDGIGCTDRTFTREEEGYDVTYSLVTEEGAAVLLAREKTAFGGSVFLSGSAFAADDVLDPGGKNPWDTPNGNGLAIRAILNIRRETLPVIPVSEAKLAEDGETVRIRGYLTAGTAVPGNTFPGMIYLQDDTGGLGVSGVDIPDLHLGEPVELYLRREGEDFLLLHLERRSDAYHLYQPKALSCADAVRHDLYGDLLVQTEGRVVSRTLTADGKGVSAFTLEDRNGNRVTVSVEAEIRSGSTGENTLADTVTESAWVRAAGIVHRHDGETVLRVRNCDEVTAVRETNKTYRVVRGDYTVWIKKNAKSVYMEVEGPGEEFLGVWVDGERIPQSHYQTTETEEGNLLFRFWPRYLKTLELGEHTVIFRFRDGEAKAILVVWNHADSPYTGDPMIGHVLMMILSGGLLLTRKRRR